MTKGKLSAKAYGEVAYSGLVGFRAVSALAKSREGGGRVVRSR